VGDFFPIIKTNELADGHKRRITIGNKEIMLARVDGKYYATDGRCPHARADLSLGRLEGTVLTCPRHGSQFDIMDGHVIRWMRGTVPGAVTRPLKTYPVKIEDDNVLIAV
jgi:3-phenylpropionate/trans-cinnamate dioxygenase ferredoxin component